MRDWGQAAGDWLISVISGRRWNRSLAAELLRLLIRQEPLSEAWRLCVIQSALSSSDIELRDAGVQAAESWEDPGHGGASAEAQRAVYVVKPHPF